MLGTFTMKTEQDQRLLEDTEDEVCPRVVACQSPWATLRIHLVIAIIYGGLATITMVVFVAGAASQPCTSRWFSPVPVANFDQDVQFNGTLTFQSPYKGAPSLALEERWDHISMLEPFGISEDEVRKLGKDPERAVKMPDGKHYLASVEVVHQLHCLNLLRQATRYDEYRKIAFDMMGTREQQQNHLEHCVDLLRQALMCQADTGLITYAWVPFSEHPTPDFNTLHKCRDFDRVRRWIVEKAPKQHIDHRKPKEGAYIWGNLP